MNIVFLITCHLDHPRWHIIAILVIWMFLNQIPSNEDVMGIVELIYPVLFDLISPSKDFWHKKIMSFLFLSLSLSLSLSLLPSLRVVRVPLFWISKNWKKKKKTKVLIPKEVCILFLMSLSDLSLNWVWVT